MIGLGTIVNVTAIIVGGCLGTLLRGGLKDHYQTALTRTLGLATIFIGIAGALPGMLEVADGQLVGKDTLGMVLALALGITIPGTTYGGTMIMAMLFPSFHWWRSWVWPMHWTGR